ncbi:MAG TPA: hypothetical protein PKK06_06375 [Phycisphaerae bacterium]|nr:hypothetical protein [Phycisphaerae bacterium]HNU44528.1 hypothetical protein [Phycisphaerae bacterium]
MHGRLLLTFRLACLLVTLGVLPGCALLRRTTPGAPSPVPPAPAAQAAAPSAPEATSPAGEMPAEAKETEAESAAKEAEEWADKEEEFARKRERAVRELNISRQRLARTQLGRQHAAIQNDIALLEAQFDLAVAEQRLSIFLERNLPTRVDWAKLGLQRAEDGTKEAEEELHQLELMYAAEDFADQTKEIVLERGRRRLERARADLDLRHREFQTLIEKTIPLETREEQQRLEQAQRRLERVKRDAAASALDQDINIMTAEATIVQQEADLKVLEKERDKAKKEHDKKQAERQKKDQAAPLGEQPAKTPDQPGTPTE